MKRTRLKSRSDERSALLKIYSQVVAFLMECAWVRCARCLVRGHALDPHHPYKRGKGKFSWKLFVVVPVCRSCHDEIHANEKQAREDGWLIEPKQKDPFKLP